MTNVAITSRWKLRKEHARVAKDKDKRYIAYLEQLLLEHAIEHYSFNEYASNIVCDNHPLNLERYQEVSLKGVDNHSGNILQNIGQHTGYRPVVSTSEQVNEIKNVSFQENFVPSQVQAPGGASSSASIEMSIVDRDMQTSGGVSTSASGEKVAVGCAIPPREQQKFSLVCPSDREYREIIGVLLQYRALGATITNNEVDDLADETQMRYSTELKRFRFSDIENPKRFMDVSLEAVNGDYEAAMKIAYACAGNLGTWSCIKDLRDRMCRQHNEGLPMDVWRR
mmetsp:Transcript_2689/g.4564  ORF Transcript_2689/g.4564 Transcript_2689/m.4564 type:complete len:282 (+) Transcript_2689:192-1037(+)